MIYAGTDLKYKVTAQIAGFTMKNNDFSITIKNRWGQVKYIIKKEAMLHDDEGNFYFTMDNVQNGSYYATFNASREDTDFDDDIQSIVDTQPLVVVGQCDCEAGEHVCETEGAVVAYQRVWTVCVEGYVYLAEADGTPILDSEGNRIYLKATGKEKSAYESLDITAHDLNILLTKRNENGKIDTLPEMLDVAGGMDEDTEVSPMTEEDAEDMMNRILGN